MIYLLAILAGLAGSGIGWLLGGLAASMAGSPIALPDIGGLPHLVARIDAGAIGAVAGMAIAVVLVLRFKGGYRTVGAIAGRSILAIIAVVAIVGGAIQIRSTAYEQLEINAGASQVEFEIRLLPATDLPPDRNDIQIELRTDKNQVLASLADVTREGARPVLHGSVPISFRTSRRELVLSLPGQPVSVFRLRLPASPAPQSGYGPWQQIDFLDQPGRDSQRADITTEIAIRYRAF